MCYTSRPEFQSLGPTNLNNLTAQNLNENTSQSGFFTPRTLIALLLCAATACSILTGTLLAFFRPDVTAKVSNRALTFEERVAYQRAIEEVYWRHRIWPKERPDPKPSVDVVMSTAQIEKKVEGYLRNSQALEDYWQRPLTAEQLQGEMERMAQHTKQPEVLRELFDALGNDPFVIAECLVRPALAERLLTNWYAYDQRIHGELRQRAEADLQTHPIVEQMKEFSGKYSEIDLLRSDSSDEKPNHSAPRGVQLNSRQWDETVQNLAATFNGSTTEKAYAFGVRSRQRGITALRSADVSAHSKNAATKTYETIPIGQLSALQEDETRYYATAALSKTDDHFKLATVSWPKEPLEPWLARVENQVPTGMAALTANYTLPSISATVGGCTDDTWAATNAEPSGRFNHTAVWTGAEMIIWGGYASAFSNTGARYNPGTDTWTPTSTTNAPTGRESHTAVWTGTEMIVWGGYDGGHPSTGGRYNPGTESWTATSTANAPTGRESHTTVWTGSEMIVWGGTGDSGFVNTGGRYNPGTDSWTATSTTNAPSSREYHTAMWTGSEMIVWGGYDGTNDVNTGGRYNPNTNSWTATSTTNAPAGRELHTAVWSGSEMIVWGGGLGDLNTGGRYNPSTNSWTATSTTNAPSGRYAHTAIWTGNEMIVWGGTDGSNDLNTGGRYNPGTNSWTPTSTTNAPTGRSAHTAVWTGSEMIVWGGYPQLNTGGRYDASTDSWAATATAPSGRDTHTAVWTGTEMIVWGGYSLIVVNTGGRYSPSTDSWTATSTTNAPSARAFHTAVWSGNEMIVWGGDSGNGAGLNTGGRYNPSTDSWTATNTTNAPSSREYHTAVWRASEMIVWGGYF